MATSNRNHADLYLAVAVGGAIGALVRYCLEAAVPSAKDGWPTATFVINLSGCLILGAVLMIARYLIPDPTANYRARLFRPFVVTGLLGGYTTFSTYAVETHALTQSGAWSLAALYAIGSIICGVALVWIAMRVTQFGLDRAGIVDPSAGIAAGSVPSTREAEDEG